MRHSRADLQTCNRKPPRVFVHFVGLGKRIAFPVSTLLMGAKHQNIFMEEKLYVTHVPTNWAGRLKLAFLTKADGTISYRPKKSLYQDLDLS